MKAVFFDIDGTLVDNCNQIPDSAKNAIQQLRKNGILTGISTGRCPSELREFLESHSDVFFDIFVYANGALVDYEGKIILKHPLPKEELSELLEIAKKHDIPYWVSDENGWHYSIKDLEPVAHILMPDELKRTNYYAPDHHLHHDVYMGEIYMDQEQIPLFEGVLKELEIVPGMLVGGKEGPMMDFWNKKINKATGLQECLKTLQIQKEDVVAIGDSFNDIPILEVAGIGVAMGNASDEVKKIANFITKPLWDDGIYYALKTLKLI